MAVTAHIKIRTTSITKLGKFKAEGTNAGLVFDLITLIEKMVRPAAPPMLGEGTAGQTVELIAKKCARPRHQPWLRDEQVHITPGLG